MSYRIEYDWAAWRVPAPEARTAEDMFVVAALGGDNNVCNSRTGARVRSWSAICLGTYTEAIRAACYFAGGCEGGSLQLPGRKWITPEGYIEKMRRLMDRAEKLNRETVSARGFAMSFKLTATPEQLLRINGNDPAGLTRLTAYRAPETRAILYGNGATQWEWTICPWQPADLIEFFAALPAFKDGRHGAWHLVNVDGPGEK